MTVNEKDGIPLVTWDEPRVSDLIGKRRLEQIENIVLNSLTKRFDCNTVPSYLAPIRNVGDGSRVVGGSFH